ncbi:MAG: DNA mismatch repair endonuclease MutL [Clostridia bacterium]|nr:DNA mismatch repair endonuclease MutL [Clostridia bacterium]
MPNPPTHRPIQRLPEEVVGKIAAGEVVESPAAAIKELMENSIDAGATAITVETREGGIAYFRVADNGCGIPASDIRMAFERHATSKLRVADELFDVRSLGFRGEALASIAAVAKVTLTTRTVGEDRGIKAINAGGMLSPPTDAASPEGTTVVVQELFFNTPARLKFLKKPAAEGARVADMVLRLLLSRPDISFRLIQNGKQVYHSPGDGKLRSAMFGVYGREVTEQLCPVEYTDGGVRVEGFVGVGTAARGNRTHQSFFVNGRYVRSPILTLALEAACRERVSSGQFPICALRVNVPPASVDVNVHPNKLEVRFSDESLVQGVMEQAVRQALLPADTPADAVDAIKGMAGHAIQSAPQIVLKDPEPPQRLGEVVQDFFAFMPAKPAAPAAPARVRDSGQLPARPTAPVPQLAGYAQPAPAPFRVLGVAFQTYILVEQENKLLLIDQHAAHERLLYERLTRSLASGQGSQELLVAQVVSLDAADRERLRTFEDVVRDAGYDFDYFGQDAVQIRGVPVILGEPQAREGFLSMLDRLGELRLLSTKEKRREAIVQMACKRAVKAGDTLEPAEIEALFRDMQRGDGPPTCPHGRPLVVVLTRQELEKRFKRG